MKKIRTIITVTGYFACSLISRVALKIGNVAGNKASHMVSKVATTNM